MRRRVALVVGLGIVLALVAVLGWRDDGAPEFVERPPADPPVTALIEAKPKRLPPNPFVGADAETSLGRLRFFVHADSAPLEGAVVSVSSFGVGEFEAASDSEGHAEVALPVGDWNFDVKLEGYTTDYERPVIHLNAGGDPLEVAVELQKIIWLEGDVVDESDRPLAGADVNEVVSDANGHFRVGLTSDQNLLRVTLDGYDGSFQLIDDLTTPLRVVLSRAQPTPSLEGSRVTGVVLDANGQPSFGVAVFCTAPLPDGGDGRTMTVSSDGGRFVAMCPASPAEMTVWGVDPKQVVDGDDVVLRLKPTRTLTGRAIDSSGRPVTSFRVTRDESDAEDALTSVDDALTSGGEDILTSDGTFELHGFEAQSYSLGFRTPRSAKPVHRSVDFSRGDVELGDVVLTRGVPLLGVTVDQLGNPVAAAAITCGGLELRTNALGRFELAVDTNQRLELKITHRDFITRLLLIDSSSREVRVVLSRSADAGLVTEYEGIGMTTSSKPVDAGYSVEAVHPGAPALEAGIRVGDEVIAVDGVPALSGSVGDFLRRVRGPANTVVMLTVRREGRVFDVRITRRRLTF